MTNITARMPQSIANLSDSKSYVTNEQGSIEKGKAGGLFTKKDVIAQSNQKVLHSLINQLKTEYGQDRIVGSELKLPEKLLSGKKAITGRDIKALTQQALKSTESRINVGPMCTAIRNVLSANPPSPGALLKAISDSIPPGTATPMYTKLLMGKVMASLSQTQCRDLTALMSGQGMADAMKLLGEAEQIWTSGFTGRDTTPEEKKEIAPHLDKVKTLRSLGNACLEGLRLANAGHNATLNGSNIPTLPQNITVGPSQQSWFTAPDEIKDDVLKSGISDVLTSMKSYVEKHVKRVSEDVILRNHEPGECMIKELTSSKVTPHSKAALTEIGALVRKLPPEVRSELNNMWGRKTFMESDRGKTFLQELGNILTKDPMKKALQECISIISATAKNAVSEKYAGAYESAMFKFINGGAIVPFTGEMKTITDPMPAGEETTILKTAMWLTQQAFAESPQGSGKCRISPSLETLPGWKEMMTLAPQNNG